jgi:hypothetical protein
MANKRTRVVGDAITTDVAPHKFERKGLYFWLCRHCYAPRSLHPRFGWTRARPSDDNTYVSADAPHFKEGW